MAAKKKRDEAEAEASTHVSNGGSHEKKKKKKKKTKEQKNMLVDADNDHVTPPTVSIALPGSIIDNTQSFELATRVFLSHPILHTNCLIKCLTETS